MGYLRSAAATFRAAGGQTLRVLGFLGRRAEQERIDLVQDYHRRARIRLPNAKVHAIVEAQIALADENARTSARRNV
jgi:hypothetical protein